MKKGFAVFGAVLLFASSAFALDFTPTPMKLTAPSTIVYQFDGKNLTVPVTVTGVGGTGALLVFTKDQGAKIGNVTNGYLGWHQVNKIDTCLYVSPTFQLQKGSNNVVWDGKDENSNKVGAGDYTYYIWAIDTVTPRVQVTKQMTINPWIYQTVLTTDIKGNPLDRPIWYKGGGNRSAKAATAPVTQVHQKWVIGSDPTDKALLETSSSPGWTACGGIAFDPQDRKYFFADYLKGSTGTKYTEKWEWVPNGASILQTSWGDNGQFSYKGSWSDTWNYGPGVIGDGKDYLFVVNADIGGVGEAGLESQLIYVDVNDGTEIKRLDLAEWWVSLEDGKNGGENCGGPTAAELRNGKMGFGSHSTCLNQVIDPYYADEKDAVLWTNSNGDLTGDHNFESNAARKWVCNDYNVGPFKYDVGMDSNNFMAFPAYGLGAVSFGLYAPDGTGMSYWTLAGETALQKYGLQFIDYGSAYDGFYCTNNAGTAVDATIWYVGQDSIKGMITNQVGVKESAPAAFSVAQNTPNPFNPTTTINFSLAKAGKTTVEVFNVAGQRVDTILNANMSAGAHSATWNAAKFSAGVYFYTVKSGNFSKTVKMTLLK